MYRWTEQETVHLVELYKTFPFLWDARHKLYKNSIARNCAYEMILEKLENSEITIMDIKIKIKNLRSSYYHELRKINKFRSEGRAYTPSHTIKVWFTKFKSIMDQVHKIEDDEDFESGSDEVSLEYIDESTGNTDTEAYVVSIKQEYLDELENQNRKEIAITSAEQPEPKKFKNAAKMKKRVELPVSEVKEYKLDEFQMFANNMAEQLRRLPLDKALELQVEVQTLIAKERIHLYREKGENSTE
ncbi:uncharacterized protein ACR2FA_011653 [Aphomia sociella]